MPSSGASRIDRTARPFIPEQANVGQLLWRRGDTSEFALFVSNLGICSWPAAEFEYGKIGADGGQLAGNVIAATGRSPVRI
jgi:hypothetical protein